MQRMAEQNLGAIAVGQRRHVYYLTGHWTVWTQRSAAIVFSDGQVWLTCAQEPDKNTAADQVLSYEAKWTSTLRQEQPAVVAGQVIEALKSRGVRRVGLDASVVNSQVAIEFKDTLAIDPELWQMRCQKDPDELKLMRKAIACTQAMYRKAKEIIEPGIPELTVFTELNAAAVHEAGEPLTELLGNDFACAARGGPPRSGHKANKGELYILDLGPVYRGYFSDNARTFSVDRKPTDKQLKAWESIVGALKIVEKLAKPGAKCREIFAAVDEHFKQTRKTNMPHHLGHGVGLQPHEYPHLNPQWDDTLLENEFFTAEPGQYSTDLHEGIRLENNYLVTKNGVESLFDFPLEMA
jgi:Xaa-Pro aminopeptidase